MKMIKVRKLKNSNLKGKEFIDDHFIDLLVRTLVFNRTWKFQEALNYKNLGLNKCEE